MHPRRIALAAALLLSAGTAVAQTTLYHESGDIAFDTLGHSVAMLGDTDGDGFPDFAAGAPAGEGFAPFHAGFARVYSGADGSTRFTITSPSAKHYFATTMAAVGDVDGDGIGDLVAGFRPSSQSPRGFATIYSGADGHGLRNLGSGVGRDNFGWSVAAAGDVDGDGFPDCIIGAPLADSVLSDVGAAYLFSGKDGSLIRLLLSGETNSNFGICVSGAGDLDADGVEDAIIGANLADTPSGMNTGRVTIHSGADGSILRFFNGTSPVSLFGQTVSRAGDLDADGIEDQLVGAPGSFGLAGVIRGYSGASGTLILAFSTFTVGDQLSNSLAPAGDVNQDGFADAVVGAPNDLLLGSGAGRAFLLAGPSGSLLAQVAGVPGDRLGQSVAGGFDLNQDGKLEFAAGSPGNGFVAPNAGLVTVFSVP